MYALSKSHTVTGRHGTADRMDMKRIIAIILLTVIVLLYTGCDTPKLTSENIKSDFVTEHYMAYPMKNYFDKQNKPLVEKFKIITRSRKETTDEMIFDASVSDSENKIKITGEYSMAYVLAGNEWMLKSFNVLSEKVTPLQNSDFSFDEIMIALNYCGFDGENIRISGRVTNLKSGRDTYKINVNDKDENVLNLALTFIFSPENGGWSVLNAECKKI